YLSLKTIVVLFLFSRNFAGVGGWFYHWLRASGVGEVTYISGALFRVFLQSQVYVLIAFFVVLTFLIIQMKSGDWKKHFSPYFYLYLSSLAIFISQSRSYWVGAVAALIFLIILAIWLFKIKLKKIAFILTILAIALVSQFYLIELITGNYAVNLVAQRFKNLPQEAAGISRLNQLKPLSEAIFQKLIFGYGFGKTLTYESRDPRILQTHPDGIYTTYAFEWGYLDIALKLGVVGLGIYLALIGYLFYLGLKNYKLQITNYKQISNLKFQIPKTKSLNDALQTTSYQLQAGLLIGLITLIVTNIFSPYLNHPLGIGYVMLLTAIFNLKD
ncbi:MAG TPA: O-antigen ligase family protein, partial [Patescibacteria group bacterium]|nr:O-antigen ligase family protein [Patescibacteria group bacterium]